MHLNKLEYSSLRIRLFESKVFHEKHYFEVLSMYFRNFTIISPVKMVFFFISRNLNPLISKNAFQEWKKINTLMNERTNS